MPETAFSFSQVESPAPETTLPQGKHLLKGWVWPKAGGHFVDVRARFGRKIFPGCHGFPRADLAAHFQTGRRHALAEFQIAVTLPPGPAELFLEVLGIDGHWQPFATVGYVVAPHQPPVDFAEPPGVVRWLDFCRGLQCLLREVAHQPAVAPADLAAALLAELPYPRDLLHPPTPMRGFVDQPAMVACARFGRLPAFGHLFHPDIPMRRVLGTVDLQTWQPLTYGQPSPGPEAFYQTAHARNCGFASLVDVPSQLPNPLSLRIYAELADDSLHLCHVVRARAHPVEEEKRPYPFFRAEFFKTILAAWNEALARHGLTVERTGELDRALLELEDEYQLLAPRCTPSLPAPLAATPETTTAPLPRRVLLATHGLSLQGAPRFLLDYARYLKTAGVEVQVVSAEEGPLRAEYAALGIPVTLVDATALLKAGTGAEAKVAFKQLDEAVDWKSSDLVVANSFTTFWAVLAAKSAGRPVLFYIHESTTPAAFYEKRVPAAVISMAGAAIASAHAVSFTTASTRTYHLDYTRTGHHRLTPGWIDVAGLDRWIAQQDRTALRQRFNLRPDELLVCNIGTVSDRKGQHTFLRAVDLFRRRHPELAARTRFILLGGRETDFDRLLNEVLQELALPNVAVHRETSDYLPYYLAADLFVCSSYEESSPRVVLEAMACRVPILASSVQGIPELVRPDREAMLLPAGHTLAWADAVAHLLLHRDQAEGLAQRARQRVESHFAAEVVLPRHLVLAAEVAAGMIRDTPSAPLPPSGQAKREQESLPPTQSVRHPPADHPKTPDRSRPMSQTSFIEIAQRHLEAIRAHYDQSPPLTGSTLAYRRTLAHYYNLIIPADASVLEIGCGGGELLGLLRTRQVCGVDFSPVQIERARRHVPHGEFFVQSAELLNLGGRQFDYIVISDTLNLVADVQRIFERLIPCAHENTRLVLNFHNALWRPILAIASSLGIRATPPSSSWLAPADIDGLLSLAGWETIKIAPRILVPGSMLGLGRLVNRWLAPLLPSFCLSVFALARRAPSPTAKPATVSVIIPARNEAGNIENAVLRTPMMGAGTELIFIEGHSRDNTWDEIQRVAALHGPHRKIKILRQTGQGKGNAVREGFAAAEGDILMILDADLTMPPEELPKFYDAVARRQCDFANGCRLVYPMEGKAMQFLNLCANKAFSILFTWLLRQPVKDTLCGTKVLTAASYRRIAAHRAYFGDFDPFGDFDLLFGADKQNLKIIDIPIRYRDRTYGETNIHRWKHGWLLLRMVLFAARKLKFV